jgi:hypothetical protein
MASWRLNDAAALFALSLLIVLMAARGSEAACNETCRRDMARCMATQCEGVGRARCRRRCKPAPIRTLAYLLSECRVNAAGLTMGHEALRIRRGDREPITVWENRGSEPAPDPLELCRQYAKGRSGAVAVVVGQLQRLGVSPDGSGVVFEVTTDTAVVSVGRPLLLPPEEQGIFFVRTDGSGLRRLGPASRDPMFRISEDPTGTFIFNVNIAAEIPFSPNGRRITFTDLGPGPGGEEAVQIVVLDLATGQRTQVTRLPSGSPPYAGQFLTAYPQFIDNETVIFVTFVDPDGSNPQHEFAAFTVRIDGSRLMQRTLPPHVASGAGSRVVPIFGVTRLPTDLLNLSVPGTAVNQSAGFAASISEIFVQDGKNLLQLTSFRRADTWAAFLNVTRTRAFFRASADPFGTNPFENCQLFSVDTFGGGLRQVTHFTSGSPAIQPACSRVTLLPDCGPSTFWSRQDKTTGAVVFESSCDPLHANPSGEQVFAMRSDGSGLRQLTDAAGLTTNPDGSFLVQLPGPFAYSARAD